MTPLAIIIIAVIVLVVAAAVLIMKGRSKKVDAKAEPKEDKIE